MGRQTVFQGGSSACGPGHPDRNTPPRNRPVVCVAAAVVQGADGRVLLAERPRGKLSAGYWELPGGKVDAGESVEQALVRELREEIGIEPETILPWMTYEHAYTDKTVRLHLFRVATWRGTPRGQEGQRLSWEDPRAPAVAPLLSANHRALQALRLPPICAIATAKGHGEAQSFACLERALAQGLRLLLLHGRGVAPAQFAQFARRIIPLARRGGAMVLIEGDESMARKVGADGVQSRSMQLASLAGRPRMGLWAASCHDAAGLARAVALGADFVVLSPVLPAAHADEAAIGWEAFRKWTHDLPVPVYAFGGMRPELLDAARRHGAHGIALLGGFCRT
ncbi:MAG: Nudix family hydrolase [Gammaproteobacteria bacterium]|nr:Nudix family hydrolase [Gammaproteobacteria bacterium]